MYIVVLEPYICYFIEYIRQSKVITVDLIINNSKNKEIVALTLKKR